MGETNILFRLATLFLMPFLLSIGCGEADVSSEVDNPATLAEEQPLLTIGDIYDKCEMIAEEAIEDENTFPVIMTDGTDWMSVKMDSEADGYFYKYGWFNGCFLGSYYFQPEEGMHMGFSWEGEMDSAIGAVILSSLTPECAAEISGLGVFDKIGLLGVLFRTESGNVGLYVVGTADHYLRYR